MYHWDSEWLWVGKHIFKLLGDASSGKRACYFSFSSFHYSLLSLTHAGALWPWTVWNSDGIFLKDSCPSTVCNDISPSVGSTGFFFRGKCNSSAVPALALPMSHLYSLFDSRSWDVATSSSTTSIMDIHQQLSFIQWFIKSKMWMINPIDITFLMTFHVIRQFRKNVTLYILYVLIPKSKFSTPVNSLLAYSFFPCNVFYLIDDLYSSW